MKFIDLTGNVYGRLTVIQKGDTANGGQIRWICQCTCGNAKAIRGAVLKKGNAKSCGCLRQESTAISKTTHGLRNSDEYRIWRHMRTRCENPKTPAFKHYGGRGIAVCDRWKTFENFFEDMGTRPTESHSIDRIDNNVGYELLNCRWATSTEQNRNRRDNRIFNVNGIEACLAEHCERLNLKYKTVHRRLVSGKSIEEALNVTIKRLMES